MTAVNITRLLSLDADSDVQLNQLLEQNGVPKRENLDIELVDIIRSPTRLYIAMDGEKLVGTISLIGIRRITGRSFLVGDLFIDESHQKTGLKQEMIQHVINDAAKNNLVIHASIN